MTDWNRLWANELSVEELRPAQIVMFMKSSYWFDEQPYYGFVDALISSLDLTPFTHTGLVARSAGERETFIVHSDHKGARSQPVEWCASPHRFGDLFVFEATDVSPESAQAVSDHAVMIAGQEPSGGEDRSYPFGDTFLLACLMRVRTRTNFDEQLHRRIAKIADLMSRRPNSKGRMCAPFVASMFADVNVPLAPPSERALYESGVTDSDLVSKRMQTGDGLRTTGKLMGQAKNRLITLLDELGGANSQELVAFRALVDQLEKREIQQMLGEWFFAPGAPHNQVTDMVIEACEGIERRLDLAPPQDLAERFVSCSDLLLSTSVSPVGHVRMWHSKIKETYNRPHPKEHS